VDSTFVELDGTRSLHFHQGADCCTVSCALLLGVRKCEHKHAICCGQQDTLQFPIENVCFSVGLIRITSYAAYILSGGIRVLIWGFAMTETVDDDHQQESPLHGDLEPDQRRQVFNSLSGDFGRAADHHAPLPMA
jgi:hypothetical protein